MTTPNLQLPEVPEAIQGASDELNAGFLRLDAIVQLAVLDKDLTSAPDGSLQGDRYIIATGAAGLWANRVGHIAFCGPHGWLYFPPRPGWRARVLDEDTDYIYSGTAWLVDDGGPGVAAIIIRGATWVKSSGAIAVPVNDVDAVRITQAGVIQRVTVTTKGGTGSCIIDIWKDSYGNYPTVVGDTICGSSKPTLTGAVKYEDATLTGWVTAVAAGDVLTFHLESSSTFRAIFIQLDILPT